MSSFGFIILHYNTIDETNSCINSIENQYNHYDYEIVVVDNASPNDSGKVLINNYSLKPKIHIILLNENIGFAKGNNIGCKWFAENSPKDFLIFCNSDLVFVDKDFLNGIETAFSKYHFDILGPDIVNPLGTKHQNPRRKRPITLKELKREIFYGQFMLKIYKNNILYKLFFGFGRKLKRAIYSQKENRMLEDDRLYLNVNTECVLYGACIVASKKFYFNDRYLFSPKTFLYYEEDFLRNRIDKCGGVSLYYPYIRVIHKVNGTTSTIGNNIKHTNIIKLQYAIDSAYELKNELS